MSLLLSKKEEKKLVIKYAWEGKTTREIAKLVHISLQDIDKIIRMLNGDEKDSENSKREEKNKRSCLSVSMLLNFLKKRNDYLI